MALYDEIISKSEEEPSQDRIKNGKQSRVLEFEGIINETEKASLDLKEEVEALKVAFVKDSPVVLEDLVAKILELKAVGEFNKEVSSLKKEFFG